MKFSIYLKTKRKARGWAVRKLGEKAGVSHTHVSCLELEKTTPTLDMVARLLKALDITWLEFAAEYAGDFDEGTLRLVRLAATLSPSERAKLLKHAEDLLKAR